jgi:hypothetical protein
MSYIVVCETIPLIGNNFANSCSSGWQLENAVGYPSTFDISMLDPATLANAFGAGFIFVGSLLLLGWSVRVLLTLIKRG